jgi:hypothetical protein
MRVAAASWIAVVAFLAALVPSAATGQTAAAPPAPPHRFEYWFGPTVVFSGLEGTITADYPVDLPTSAGSGRATQQLSLTTPTHLGVEGGIGVFPSRQFGLKARFTYVSEDLSGTSGMYEVSFDSMMARPPDFVPAPSHTDSVTPWPAPTGSSSELTLSVEGVVRWETGARVSGALSGGVAYFRAKGHVDSLAYTQYAPGGQDTVSSTTYAMSVAYGTATAIGFDVGGEVAVALAGPLAFLADVRYFHAGRVTPDVRVTGFADPSASPGDLTFQAVNAQMAPIKASFDPSFARIFFGVRIRS